MSSRSPGLAIPRRVQRVIRVRWLYAGVLLALGWATWLATGQTVRLGLVNGALVLGYNLLLVALVRRFGDRADDPRLAAWQIFGDSLTTIIGVHSGLPLTPAVQFLFLFPIFVATMLSPREGLFLTAAFCGLGYAFCQLLVLVRIWPAPPAGLTEDPSLHSLITIGVVIGALLAAATVNNYLVRTLAGIEADLADSETKYRELAGSLEDEVRQRTADLRETNDTLNARHRELVRLREIDTAIHQGADLPSVLQRVTDYVAEIVPHSEAVIYLAEPNTDDLRLASFSRSGEKRLAAIESLVGRRLPDWRLPVREGTIVEYAVRTREPIVTNDFRRTLDALADGPRQAALVPDIARILGFRSGVALPLEVGDDLIGLLAVGSRDELSAADLDRVRAFATQAAMAIVRVRQERDLLEQRAALEQAYLELKRSQDQVVTLEKMRALGEMTSGVAHNFNNALTAILGTAQLVLREDLPQTVLHRLRIVERTAQDASQLVQRIRAFTRDEPLETVATDLNELLADAVAMTEPRWKHHADTVERPISCRLSLNARRPVEAEASAVREVLINLILNAVNAMPRGGEIVCRTWDEDDQVCVAIRDTGVGMDEETRRRCFEPFYTTDQEKGTGLGLSVAYGIIQRHDGDIRVTSQPGVGTEFVIALPSSDRPPVAPAEAVERAAPEVEPLHALVVDDQAMVRETLGEMLRALGHQVTVVSEGRQALEVFDPDEHQLVITDWGMPGMSGLAVARAIKSRSPGTRVILITGLDANLPEEVLGADEIDERLQKPVALAELAKVVGLVKTPA